MTVTSGRQVQVLLTPHYMFQLLPGERPVLENNLDILSAGEPCWICVLFVDDVLDLVGVGLIFLPSLLSSYHMICIMR